MASTACKPLLTFCIATRIFITILMTIWRYIALIEKIPVMVARSTPPHLFAISSLYVYRKKNKITYELAYEAIVRILRFHVLYPSFHENFPHIDEIILSVVIEVFNRQPESILSTPHHTVLVSSNKQYQFPP